MRTVRVVACDLLVVLAMAVGLLAVGGFANGDKTLATITALFAFALFCLGLAIRPRQQPVKRAAVTPFAVVEVSFSEPENPFAAQAWQSDPDQLQWVADSHENRLADIKDQIEIQRDFERDGRKHGFHEEGHRAAGFVIQVGKACSHAAHLNGAIVSVENAKRNPALLPPYNGCHHRTCECQFDLIMREEVPRHARWVS